MKSSFKKINAALSFSIQESLEKVSVNATMAFHYIRGSINNDVDKGKGESHNFIYTIQFALQ